MRSAGAPRRDSGAILIRSADLALGLVALAVLVVSIESFAADITGSAPATGGERQATPSLGPAPDPSVLRRSFELIEQRRTEQARILLEPVVAAHPKWARAQFYLGLTYHKEHRYALARPLFERALSLEPGYRPARLFYGWCLYYLGELDRSREAFLSYLAARPDDADSHFALGLIELDRDHVESAEERLREAIRLARERNDAPVEAKAQARLGDALMRAGDLAEARKALQRSLELNPDNPESWFKLALVLERAGDAEGARKAREKYETLRERGRPAGAVYERKPVQ